MKKAIILSVPILLIIVGFTLCSFKAGQKTIHKDEIVSEINSYVTQQIIPVLKPLREELEPELSETEKKEIEAIRLKLIDLRQARVDAGIDFFEIMEAEEQFTPEQVEVIKTTRKQFRKTMMQAWTIADNHEVEIEYLLLQTKDYKDQWKVDIKQIVINKLDDQRKRFLLGRKESRFAQLDFGEYFMPLVFLLYDTENPEFMKPIPAGDIETMDFTIYPNPAKGQCNIKLDVKKESRISIRILDKNGLLLQTIPEKKYLSGEYVEILAIQNLKAGYYIVELKSGSDKISKTLIIK